MADTWETILFAVIFWPGLIGGAVLGWFYLWLNRKIIAKMQRRIGPPFYQPFYDFVKLLGKKTIIPTGVNPILFYALPLISVVSTVLALVVIPIPGNFLGSFKGDLVLLLYLLEMPAICDVLAGYVTHSVYGQVSSARESILLLGYNLPFLSALIALAVHAHSFEVNVLSASHLSIVTLFAAIAFILAVPARLKSNPFSIPNAEQEIVASSHIEYNGKALAFFELAHALEFVALVNIFLGIILPTFAKGWGAFLIFLLLSVLIVALVSLLSASTARIKIDQAFKFYWKWGAAASLAALIAAVAF